MAEHYANAFTITPGQCFRMVVANGSATRRTARAGATHGRWRSAANKLYRVDACDGHKGELAAPIGRARPVVASLGAPGP